MTKEPRNDEEAHQDDQTLILVPKLTEGLKNGWFKPTARIFKNMRNRMIDQHIIKATHISVEDQTMPSGLSLLLRPAHMQAAVAEAETIDRCLASVWGCSRSGLVRDLLTHMHARTLRARRRRVLGGHQSTLSTTPTRLPRSARLLTGWPRSPRRVS